MLALWLWQPPYLAVCGGLFARFAGIFLGPEPQGTRQQDTKQHHHHKIGHRKKSKRANNNKKTGFAAGIVHTTQILEKLM
jgi:hypothetical protein